MIFNKAKKNIIKPIRLFGFVYGIFSRKWHYILRKKVISDCIGATIYKSIDNTFRSIKLKASKKISRNFAKKPKETDVSPVFYFF